MTTYIRIGGKERPVSFGYSVAYTYESRTGGNYNALIMQIAQEVQAAGEAVSDNDLGRVATAMHVKPIADLVFFGMAHAHRKEGLEVDFEPEDVADWIFGDQNAMTQCMAAFFDSLPKAEGGGVGGDSLKKKQQGPRPKLTGTASSKRQRR